MERNELEFFTEGNPGKKYNVTLKETDGINGALLQYEHYQAFLPVAEFNRKKKFKYGCKGCPVHGKNLSCPPYSPGFTQYLGTPAMAKVICIRMPLVSFEHSLPEERYRLCFRRAKSILEKELYVYRERGFLVAGSGECLACEECVIVRGSDKCRKPEKRIYSLESLGISLTSLVESCFDFELEWSGDGKTAEFICSIGAVFPVDPSYQG